MNIKNIFVLISAFLIIIIIGGILIWWNWQIPKASTANEKNVKLFDLPPEYSFDDVIFSPNGKHIAIHSYKDVEGEWQSFLFLDGKIIGGPYNEIGDIYFSPDGEHFIYEYLDKDRNNYLVTDGKEIGIDGYIMDAIFSPDNSRFAYTINTDTISDNPGVYMILLGEDKKWGPYDGVGSMSFSPDSKHFAFVPYGNVGEGFVILDGEEGPAYENFWNLKFSSDSKYLHYLATSGNEFWQITELVKKQ